MASELTEFVPTGGGWGLRRGEVSVLNWDGGDGPGIEVCLPHQDSLLLYRQDVSDLIALLERVRERLPP